MARYIITYDLRKPGRNYDELYKRIKSYRSWAHITESSWAVATTQTSGQIRDHLKGAMDSDDKLLVGILGTSAWFGLPDKVGQWIKDNA